MSSEKILMLEKPLINDCLKILRHALSRRRTVIVAGVCRARYRGRARSSLEDGERVLLIKSDGNVLIHRPTGLEPVNYMPSTVGEGRSEQVHGVLGARGCLFKTDVEGECLVVKAVQRRSRESLRIVFKEVFSMMVMSLVDDGRFSLYASEQDMQRAVLQHPDLIEEGFRPINYEKKVDPGFIDVYGVDSRGRLVVVEIKRRRGDKAAVKQLAKYMEAVKGDREEGVRGVLAAPRIGQGVQKLLATLNLEFKPLNPRKCAEILDRVKREKGLEAYFNSSS